MTPERAWEIWNLKQKGVPSLIFYCTMEEKDFVEQQRRRMKNATWDDALLLIAGWEYGAMARREAEEVPTDELEAAADILDSLRDK